MRNHFRTAYLAPEGYEELLAEELPGVVERYGSLFLTDREPHQVFWSQNIWHDPFVTSFNTISEAAGILKNIQRNWTFYPYVEIRRASLIQDKLPYLSRKPLSFPCPIPKAPMGSWTLLDKNTLLASGRCSSPFSNGRILFEECHTGPPSRAYLKLWEALTLLGKMPSPGERCLEIGASPGGWTWVLASLGADVLCVDRSPLAPEIAKMPGVSFQVGNAFSMTPDVVGDIDWIFSDVACYPEKLLDWVMLWIESGKCKTFVATLKFQGKTSYDIARVFAKIPGSRVVHLGYNKHELTWLKVN